MVHALCHDRSAASPQSSLAWIVRLDIFSKVLPLVFFCSTFPATFVVLRTRYIEHALVSRHTCDKQQNSKKRSHGIFLHLTASVTRFRSSCNLRLSPSFCAPGCSS